MSCCCWRKRKPGGSHHTGKKLSTDPSTCCWWKLRKADSSHDTAVLETDPLIETPNKPSTDQSLTCSSTISSNSQQPPPNLEEVLRSFKDLDITSQADAFIHAIEQYLEGATVQKNAPDTPTASPSNTDKLTNWDSFLQSGSEFLKFVSDHTEKNDKHEKQQKLQEKCFRKLGTCIGQLLGFLLWHIYVGRLNFSHHAAIE
ncbi:hypothetical protein SUGI_0453110 [Cryptomeria japonica]|nr:hypothetical protein SUGI_0453110 [Cryptomeria japonica]